MTIGVQNNGFALFHGSRNLLKTNTQAALAGKTKFPHSLHVPQRETERILVAKLNELGGKVFRNKRVIGYAEKGDGIEVSFDSTETIWTEYLCGTDGSKSTVSVPGASSTQTAHGIFINPDPKAIGLRVYTSENRSALRAGSPSRSKPAHYLCRRILCPPPPQHRSSRLHHRPLLPRHDYDRHSTTAALNGCSGGL